MKEQKHRKYILIVSFIILPLLIGFLIYAFGRSKLLIMNIMIYNSVFGSFFQSMEQFIITKIPTNEFVKYSLPDGLWLFAFGNALMLFRKYIWNSFKLYIKIFFVTIIVEVLQIIFEPIGTFDVNDILAYFFAFILSSTLSFYIYYKINQRSKYEKGFQS